MRCSYYYWLGLEVQSGNRRRAVLYVLERIGSPLDTVEVWGVESPRAYHRFQYVIEFSSECGETSPVILHCKLLPPRLKRHALGRIISITGFPALPERSHGGAGRTAD